MIDMECPHCGQELHIDDKYAGQSGRCKHCHRRITLPGKGGWTDIGEPSTQATGQSPVKTYRLTESERTRLAAEMDSVRKSPTVAVLLAGLLGLFGAHKFYMRKYVQGAIYIILAWTLIPLIFAIVDMFFMPGRVRRWNVKHENDIVQEIIKARGG